jgi:tripartite-type tricarboxylate transporter receptor subunit TctC
VPEAVLVKLHAAAAAALHEPEVVRAITDQGMEPVGGSRADFAALIRADVVKWAAVIRRGNIRAE